MLQRNMCDFLATETQKRPLEQFVVVIVQSLICVLQAPLSMEFPRQEYWSRLPCPPPGDLLDPGIEPTSLMPHALASRFFIAEPPQKGLTWRKDHRNPPPRPVVNESLLKNKAKQKHRRNSQMPPESALSETSQSFPPHRLSHRSTQTLLCPEYG